VWVGQQINQLFSRLVVSWLTASLDKAYLYT
jgi:hypothetical protein